MIKKLALLAAGLAAVVILLLVFIAPRIGPERPVSLAFIGFTNTPERIEALFWFSNRADLDFTWRLLTRSYWSPTGWVDAVPDPAGRDFATSYGPAAGLPDVDVVAVPVALTNVPMRVVLEYSELESVRQRRRIWWDEFRANWGNTNKVQFSRRADHSVTGQTVIAHSRTIVERR